MTTRHRLTKHANHRTCAYFDAGLSAVRLLAPGVLLTMVMMAVMFRLSILSFGSSAARSIRVISSDQMRLTLDQKAGWLHFFRHNEPVLSAHVSPAASSVSVLTSRPGCIRASVKSGGALRFPLSTGGHWYGGPAMAHAAWPSSLARIEAQRFASHDMLADRSRLGSVLEAIWLTSTGASVQVLPKEAPFELSMNVACGSAAPPSSGQLCLVPTSSASLEMEICVADDVREAHRSLLHTLPRPVQPQPPSLELMRKPIWSTWARYKMDVDQYKVSGSHLGMISPSYVSYARVRSQQTCMLHMPDSC